MTSKLTTYYEKKEKRGSSIKQKFQKIFGFPKIKNNKLQEKSCCVKKEEHYESHYEFDAVPDLHRSKSNADSEEEILKELLNRSEEEHINDHSKKSNTKQPLDANSERFNQEKGGEQHEFSSSDSRQHNFSFYGQNPGSNGQFAVKNETNITVNNGNAIHIGNVYNQTNYVNGVNKNAQQTKMMEKTPAIKDMLKSSDQVNRGHLQFLSQHFGKQWKDIGEKIGITTGELENIKKLYRDYEERGFQMLSMWCQERGDSVTLGELTKKLWKTSIHAAQEAVHQLSVNKENLE